MTSSFAGDPSAEAPPMVTVVMPIRNESGFIGGSLKAVLEQDYPRHAFEVIVADGMSDDGTREQVRALQARHPNLRLIDNPGRIVPCGLNLAIAQARGDIIVRVDGHTVVSPDYVAQCVAALRRTGAENVGGRMLAVGQGWFGEGVALASSSPFGVGGARFHYSDREESVDTVYMGTWWRNTFERLGAFDEELVRNQDDEFNYRILDHGGRVMLIPGIRSVYTVRGSPRTLWRQYFQYGLWKVRVMRKHPRQIRLRQTVPSLFVVGLAGSWLVSWFFPPARQVGAVIALSYLFANLASSLWVAGKGRWKLVPGVALSYGIMHFAYGIGLLVGLTGLARAGRTTARATA